MRPLLLFSCAALAALAGCIEEPVRVIPVGGLDADAEHAHGSDHAAMGHGGDHAAMGHGETDMDGMDVGAMAQIAPLGGSGVTGTVTFTQLAGGQLRVEYMLRGLEPGPHGFHVHENGSCAAGEDGTPGGAAGGHFNPADHPHGAPEAAPTARHVGDFGNIIATASGEASGTFTDQVARLLGPDSIVGKALVVHGGTDDLQSQPSGEAGPRVGCGVIGA